MPLIPIPHLISAFILIFPSIYALPSANASTVCSILQRQYPKQYANSAISLTDLSLGVDYLQARSDYWSQANFDNRPACIFFPTSAQDVAFVVAALNNYTNVPWAAKGGGHNPNVGYSSTKDGVLISFEQKMAKTTLDSNNLAHVQPGNRWIDVATALEPSGRAVVSGRLGHVGAAGLTLGGGLSFLSTEYGMTADTVVSFEVVTADAKIQTASATQNSDLFYALKGGGNQFAIVTEFVFQTFPIGPVWGGFKLFTLDKKAALINATHNLVSDYYDPKAAVIVTFSTTVDTLLDIFVVFFFYNGPGAPGKILDEFNSIPAVIDSTKSNRSYRDLIDANSAFSLSGMRYLIRTGTLPSLPGAQGIDVFSYTFDSWFSAAKKYQILALDNYVFSLAYQPVPHQLANASMSSPTGVNLLGLDPAHGDKVFMEYDVSWLLPTTDARAAAALTNITQPAQDYAQTKYAGVRPTNWQSGDVGFTNYNPMFMNDCMFNQDPLRSYGAATYDRLKQIQRNRDPKGFFSQRTGGFKFT